MARKRAFKTAIPATNSPSAGGERSLDPVDWVRFRETAHRALDMALEHLERAADRPVWQPVPESVAAALNRPLPRSGQALESVLHEYQELIQPYATGNTHPRFFGWVHGSGLADGVLAEMLAASMNSNLGGREHGAIHVERQVITWCKSIFGFPEAASGLLVSGTSMATLIGLAVARHVKAGIDIRARGVGAIEGQLVAYTSKEAHGSVARAFEILGLGRDCLRSVPVKGDFTLDCQRLAEMIEADRAAGAKPFAIIATAGTVNSGAIDDLSTVADLAQTNDLWLHVDGAFGALAVLAPELKPRLAGIERADSLAFDFHKWMHVPYDAGCILVRDGAAHLSAFGSRADYLAGADRGLAAGEPWFCEFGPELSRGFRALKVWFALKCHGAEAFGAKILDNCRQAAALGDRISGLDTFELLAPVGLNIVCFRYLAEGLNECETDLLNGEIVIALQELGIAAPSTTRIGGRLAIRANFTNHRTRLEDVDILVDAIGRLGPEIAVSIRGQRQALPQPIKVLVGECRLIEQLLSEPEFAPFAMGLTIGIDGKLEDPFRIGVNRSITFSAHCLQNAAAGRVLLRHALECLNWPLAGLDDPAREIAYALAAARAAALYMSLRPAAERDEALRHMPGWLAAGYGRLVELDPWSMLSAQLDPGSELVAKLLLIGGGNPRSVRLIGENIALKVQAAGLLAELLGVAAPSEHLLTCGDDPRISLQPTGTNSYGALPRPVACEFSYASSTAASPSVTGWTAVEGLRHRLIKAAREGELQQAIDDEAAALMCELADRLGADAADDTDIFLAPSGTHVVYSALAIAAARDERPLLSIVIAPDETGSGVPLAAAGRRFFGVRGRGAGDGAAGDPVAGLLPSGIQSMSIEIRTPRGQLRALDAVDADVEAAVEAAVAADGRVVLFALDGSKLGSSAPSAACIVRLMERYRDKIDVVVDACQMRLAPVSIAQYLQHGAMVQVTGSKFIGGVAFSGALLVPERIARQAQKAMSGGTFGTLALSLSDPSRWERHNAHLSLADRLALVARWRTATAELDEFLSVAPGVRGRRLRRIGNEVVRLMRARPELKLVPVPAPDRSALGGGDPWQGIQTIFSFAVMQHKGRRARLLSLAEARHMHRLMLMDLSGLLPAGVSDRDVDVGRQRCHIGQPVRLAHGSGRETGVLRLCLNARSVSRIGRRRGDTIGSVVGEIEMVLDKAQLVARHFDHLVVRS